MTAPIEGCRRALGRSFAATVIAVVILLMGCGSEGTGNADFYGEPTYSYPDPWYYNGCCVDRPDDIGPPPPRPEHPIATPPGGARPSQPIASPTPSPRPAFSGGGGGFRGGGGGGGARGGGRR